MSEWISVDDRLPEDGKQVLVYPGWATDGSGIAIDEYCSDHNCFLMEIEEADSPATHWMPLPEPPEEVE